jgi:hypothetical protein
MKTIVLLFTIFLAQNCNQKTNEVKSQENLPAPIEYVFFQNWVGGRPETGSGTNFEIKFKSSFPKGYKLSRLFFGNKVSDIQMKGDSIYVAYFYRKPNLDNLNLDEDPKKEYGNQAPENPNSQFDLQPNEAILEFMNGQKMEHYKLTKIKEKEFLAYPTARPDNQD